MEYLVKIPGVELNTWAGNTSWERLFHTWSNARLAGVIVPVSLNDQLSSFVDYIQTLTRLAHARRLQIWIIFPVLNNPIFYYRHPESHPVHRSGEKFQLPGWFAPVCPTHPEYHHYFEESVRRLLTRIRPDALVLDYLRIPYFWEEWGNGIASRQWPPYCYCDRCKRQFEQENKIPFSEVVLEEWLAWQGRLVRDWLARIRELIQQLQPGLRIGIQVLPLVNKEKRTIYSHWVGQNLQMFQKYAHFLSPLVYEKLLNWENDEILMLLVEMLAAQRLPVIPSLQISSIKWDRKKNTETSLSTLIRRMKPLNITEATLFHARDLLTERDIRARLR